MCPKWPQNCQQWPNFENNFTYLRPSRRRREGRHYRKHMLDDPPNMIDLINYVFCSSQSLCSNHSMWPFVAFYVPEVHGDIPPSLMVLFLNLVPFDPFSQRVSWALNGSPRHPRRIPCVSEVSHGAWVPEEVPLAP